MRFLLFCASVLLYIVPSECFLDLSGIIPNEYKRGQPVEVRAVKLASSKTQIPYKYYDLDFCKPDQVIHYDAENFGTFALFRIFLGEILRGDRPVNTRYNIKMGMGVKCAVLCKKEMLSKQSITAFGEFILEDYSIHLTMDQLLGASLYRLDGTKGGRYNHGVRIGIVLDGVPYIYNHLKFKLQYNTVDNDQHRLVGFEVEPFSISEVNFKFEGDSCELTKNPITLENWKAMKGDVKTLYFTYEVIWEPSDIRWASRWDIFLKSQGEQIHWFSIVNSLVIVMFLTSVISMILIRTLRKDIAKYNRDEDLEDILEESGWKLVHGDVFRPPRRPRLLTALVGSGVQIHCMVSIIIFFAMLGMLSPAIESGIDVVQCWWKIRFPRYDGIVQLGGPIEL
ncbi:Transmembrane 9 superfamily member [Fasciola gigantica]|uniref:Transmembrane 9 superfamily member n=1 Tax=Fasciola gigantica TaxID=46835 RepID=A0A504YWT0_FASGI|nr:Transmembrane 9 superfamily member [Fasciola gigantica]